jgi:outer membrane beta-barrel protein
MPKRLSLLLLIVSATLALGPEAALAQQKKKKKPAKKPPVTKKAPASQPAAPPEVEIEVTPDQPAVPPSLPPSAGPTAAPETAEPEPADASKAEAGKPEEKPEAAVSWQDIVVVTRKTFLKANRLELVPMIQITLNDNMIRHYGLTGQLNYWLTDVLAVGVEGQLFRHQFLEPYDLVATAYRRLPTLNQYNFGASLNFHYVPFYAKFAVFNAGIVHWEGMITAGVGVTQSEIIPRDPQFPGWTNTLITPNIGFTSRFFLFNWLTFDLGVRDYIFVDKFESVNRMTADVDMAKSNATSQLINHVMFTAGVSFWIPPSFSYTTFR